MKLLDRLKSLTGQQAQVDEIVQAAQADEDIVVPANREYIRATRRANRLKGPGYTRPYRKGRDVRERQS